MKITGIILPFIVICLIGCPQLCKADIVPIMCQNDELWKSESYFISDREQIVTTKLGFPMLLDSKDNMVSTIIREQGVWEGGLATIMKKMVKKGDSIINIGSQTGMEVIMMARKLGPTGKVYIFEPFSFSYQLVRKNVYLNDLQDIAEVYKLGASNKFQSGSITVGQFNTGGSRISGRQDYQKSQIEGKATESIDLYTVVETVGLARVDDVLPKDFVLDFALIDVQGMEVEALDGMTQIIRRSPNLIIFTEWLGDLPNRNVSLIAKMAQFFADQGYTAHTVKSTGDCTYPKFNRLDLIDGLPKLKIEIDIILLPKGKSLPKY